MSSLEILIVEDEQATREMLAFALRRAGFIPQMAADAQSAQQHLATHRPYLVLIDWMLPDTSGIELIRSIRSQPAIRDLSLMMVTARATEVDQVAGLDSGADDYVTKPFSPRELVARVQALLRRSDEDDDDRPLELEGLRLDPSSLRVSAGDDPLEVGPD
jgi:two-component system phosphate regulon response regulator PhoB